MTPRVQARRDHPRHLPARHRRLARPRPAQERPRRPGTSPSASSRPRRTRERALGLGAMRVLPKPLKTRETLEQLLDTIRDFVERPVKDLLVVGPTPADAGAIVDSIGGERLPRDSGRQRQGRARASSAAAVDCVVLDLDLPDMTTDGLVERHRARAGSADLPVIFYSDRRRGRRRAGPRLEPRPVRDRPPRPLARAAPRPDRLLPPLAGRQAARAQAADARGAATRPTRCSPARRC